MDWHQLLSSKCFGDRQTHTEAELGSPCKIHSGERDTCSLPPRGTVDIVVGSGPCEPFSALRNGAGSRNTAALNHAGYNVSFGETGSLISVVKSLCPVSSSPKTCSVSRNRLTRLSPTSTRRTRSCQKLCPLLARTARPTSTRALPSRWTPR